MIARGHVEAAPGRTGISFDLSVWSGARYAAVTVWQCTDWGLGSWVVALHTFVCAHVLVRDRILIWIVISVSEKCVKNTKPARGETPRAERCRGHLDDPTGYSI